MPPFDLSTRIEDDDWDPLYVVSWRSAKDCPEIAILSPGGLDAKHWPANVAGFKQAVFGGPLERIYVKLSSKGNQPDDPSIIVSFISGRVHRGPKGIIDGDLATTPPPTQLPQVQDSEDRAFYEWYWDSCSAALLINWILDFTAKEKLGRCALLASSMAVDISFYEKSGFRVIDRREVVDDVRFPGKRASPVVTMIRDI
ncbi:hypothetical protein MMC25_007445 [Agyrium rufum]|nr:hypothetical protein [Agyrium rufum]